MSVNSGLKASKIIGQRKAFYRQRILGSSCARKETVGIEIFVISRNGDRKIIQSIRITSRPPSRIRKGNQLSQLRRASTKVIYTYRKDLSWLHFDDEPMVQEWQQAKEQQFCISVFVAYLTIPQVATRSTSPDMTTVFHTWPYGKFVEITSGERNLIG